MWRKRIYTLIICIVTVVLQTTVLQRLAIVNVVPNLFIIVIVSFSALRGRYQGLVFAVFFGLAQDIFYGGVVGFYVLIYSMIAIFSGYLYRNYYPNSIVIPIIAIGISDWVYNIYVFMTTYLLRGSIDIGYYTLRIYFPELTYTVFVSILLYRLIFIYSNYLSEFEKTYRKGDEEFNERTF